MSAMESRSASDAGGRAEASARRELRRIRLLLGVVIVGLVVSGLTALPLEGEMRLLARWLGADGPDGAVPALAAVVPDGVTRWVVRVRDALIETNARHPFIAYGTDWLAFAHVVIAIAFIGPWRDPARNVWVVEFGLIACVLVVPFALLMGGVRGIPLEWRLIDCAFGVLAFPPLWWCRRCIRRLAARPGFSGVG